MELSFFFMNNITTHNITGHICFHTSILTPLLLVFRRLIPYFTSHANVIAIDLPPFGKSGKLTSFVYSYEILLNVIDFIHHLRIFIRLFSWPFNGGTNCSSHDEATASPRKDVSSFFFWLFEAGKTVLYYI